MYIPLGNGAVGLLGLRLIRPARPCVTYASDMDVFGLDAVPVPDLTGLFSRISSCS
jgi:hypothetical protein